MSKTAFDDLTDLYDAMIDWPKRLANEASFYREWYEKIAAQSVVDVACGTGRHAAMFSEWGLKVEGADLSPAMIAKCRSSFGENERLRWVVRGFDQPIEFEPGNIIPLDVAICMGNSLALAPDIATVERALEQMFSAIRPGGFVMIQVLNLWQLADGPCGWQKCKLASLGKEEAANDVLILKGVHRCNTRGYVEFLAASPTEGKLLHHESVTFLGLEASHLEQTARAAGAKTVHFFGDYKQNRYKPEKSPDLIMVAEK